MYTYIYTHINTHKHTYVHFCANLVFFKLLDCSSGATRAVTLICHCDLLAVTLIYWRRDIYVLIVYVHICTHAHTHTHTCITSCHVDLSLRSTSCDLLAVTIDLLKTICDLAVTLTGDLLAVTLTFIYWRRGIYVLIIYVHICTHAHTHTHTYICINDEYKR